MDQKERKAATRRKNWKRRKRKRKGERGEKSVMFACLEEEETDPTKEEIPENEAHVAHRHINLANVLGRNDWGRKNWAQERSSIIDTGFNGGGLCGFSWLNIYGEYLRSFYPKAELFKKE